MRTLHDPKLVALVRAAEEGKECPPLRIMTATGLFVGAPGRSEGLADSARPALWAHLRGTRPSETTFDPSPEVTEQLRPVTEAEEAGEEPTVLTLYGVRWFSTAGFLGLSDVPVVRIPLSSVVAWWIAGGTAISAPATDAEKRTWFAGVLLTLG